VRAGLEETVGGGSQHKDDQVDDVVDGLAAATMNFLVVVPSAEGAELLAVPVVTQHWVLVGTVSSVVDTVGTGPTVV
jgi:hypothetical protein